MSIISGTGAKAAGARIQGCKSMPDISKFGGLFDNYQDYLKSDIWKERKDFFLEDKQCCEICGIQKQHIIRKLVCINWIKAYYKGRKCRCTINSECKHEKREWRIYTGKPLVVHHESYGNVGNESSDDLIAVCFDCHNKLHKDIAWRG